MCYFIVRYFIQFLLLLTLINPIYADESIDVTSFITSKQERRYHNLINEIRCPVCQGQSIGGSNAGLAKDLREKVRGLILKQKTDDDIRRFMTDRYGDFVALIGRNGEGKSTFMRVLAGEIEPDDGKLKVKNGIKISYLEQTPPENNDKNLFDIVAEGLGDIGMTLIQYQHLMADGKLDQATKLQEKIDQLDAWQYLHKIETILQRFTLSPEAILSTLSGGWRRRVMLAKALIQEPNILLLDEPTNHMDITAILDLEKMLRDFHGTLVLISHDRSFVAGIVNKVFDLDRGNLNIFECGYQDYVKRKDNLLNSEELANQRFDKKLAQEEVWIRQGIKARRTRNEGRVRSLQEMRASFVNRRQKQGKVKIHSVAEDEKRASKLVFEVKKISYKINDLELIKEFGAIACLPVNKNWRR
jgi:ATP-binding cassette subfamily F protein uup